MPIGYQYHAKNIAGVSPYFYLPREEDIDYFEQSGGAPEAPLIEWASQFLVPNRAFFDIGSHVGTWGITYAMLGAQTFAFEANPSIAELCKMGFAANGLFPSCTNVALSNKRGTARLTAPHIDCGGGSIVREFDNPVVDIPVNMVMLDDFVDLLPYVGFMKIDVEGAELDVLGGAVKKIMADRPTIIFECWEDEHGQRKEDLFRYIHDNLRYDVQPVTWQDTWIAEPR